MDIQKEREAFEYEFKQTDYYIAHGDLSTLMLCGEQYALDDVQVSFDMWQAAKAQAMPEGFLLMPRKCTNKMAHAAKAVDGRLSAFKYADVYDAMIEAQEPANDTKN